MPINDERRNWTRDEVILALGLYFQIPWGKISQRNPEIQRLAACLGRSSGALGRKMGNLGRFDSTLAARGVTGLVNGAKMDEIVWREFEGRPDELAREYSRVLTKFGATQNVCEPNPSTSVPNPVDVDMGFFRMSVLSAYGNACCITGINDERLLAAYHFKPLDQCTDNSEKMNPQNGVCFSGLYGDAFTKGLITIDESLKVVLSPSLKDHLTAAAYDDFFKRYDNTMIRVPVRSRPGVEFIHYHNERIFAA